MSQTEPETTFFFSIKCLNVFVFLLSECDILCVTSAALKWLKICSAALIQTLLGVFLQVQDCIRRFPKNLQQQHEQELKSLLVENMKTEKHHMKINMSWGAEDPHCVFLYITSTAGMICFLKNIIKKV